MLPAPLTDRAQRLHTRLELLASDLQAMWATALEQGDFRTIDRLVEASHAVQRAILALHEDDFVPARPASAIDIRSAPELRTPTP